jgi:hypothetical protein
MSEPSVSDSGVRRWPLSWVLVGAAALSCLALPTLATPFDFIDDGNLVYPAPPMSLFDRAASVWQAIVDNYEHLGPFRPVLHVHWALAADWFEANALCWRCARLGWMVLATVLLLLLLGELGIQPAAALLAAALSMWNPYRNEIWTSLTLSEGVAMPYALLALYSARRAVRSRRPLGWDLLGAGCVLAALGCKNTFAALVPAQLVLRVAPDCTPVLAGLRRHGRRAAILGLTLLLPIGHYLYFKLNWHPGQYDPPGASWLHFLRQLKSLKGAVSAAFLAPGLFLSLAALFVAGRRAGGPWWALGWPAVWQRHRAACLAGSLLVAAGVAVYLPLGAISGRYTIPAVWGLDLLIAALLSTLVASAGVLAWKRAALVAYTVGLLAVAVANVGRQEKFSARAELLWQVLEYVEREVPPGAAVAWASGPRLNEEEGIHFLWHLRGRGRKDLGLVLLGPSLRPLARREAPGPTTMPTWVVTATATPPRGSWRLREHFAVPFWGRRCHHCYLWTGTGLSRMRKGECGLRNEVEERAPARTSPVAASSIPHSAFRVPHSWGRAAPAGAVAPPPSRERHGPPLVPPHAPLCGRTRWGRCSPR